MKKITTVIIIFLVGTLIISAQEKKIDLINKRITINMEKQPLGLVFRYLMKNYDIPIGFEKSTLDAGSSDYVFETNLPEVAYESHQSKDRTIQFDVEVERAFFPRKHWITINADDERLEDVFNTIVRQMENYKWEINNDVINIFPVKGRDQRFQKLLETNISSFIFKKGSSVKSITTNIKKLPEFQKFLKENNFYFDGFRTMPVNLIEAQYGRKVDVEMNFSNKTFRELLNEITKIKKGGWILKNKGRLVRDPSLEYLDIDI